MKIRMNYVSNSSSSSFVIIGQEITDINNFLKGEKDIYVCIENGGSSGDCADWIMKLTKESYEILIKSKWFNFHKDRARFFENESCFIDKDELLNIEKDMKEVEIFSFNRDYSSPDNIKELKEFLEEQ